MRNLVVLRGCPGAGKSTWIKENGLEPYTLSPDNIRQMVSAPIYTEEYNTDFTISQENESYVWSLLFEMLEKRMQNGDFTIIDATHSRSSDFSRYNSLCETYRYRKYVVSFTDVPMEVCKQRNLEREPLKRVPEQVIEKMYARFATQEKTSGWKDIPRDKFWETFSNQLYNFNDYKQIHIIGDIHGCYEPLKEYILKVSNVEAQEDVNCYNLKQFMNSEDAYIFVGDYIDRGIQNKEVLEFIYEICENKNVLLLEGNHEKWLWYYANNLDEQIKSKEFIQNTIPQIKDIEPSKLRYIYRKLGQMAYITYNNQNYFINHAGLATLPNNISLVSTSQFIRGVGNYSYNVDEQYTNNVNETNTIQIHGHRKCEPFETDKLPTSFSLEDSVEKGGNLVCLQINNKGKQFHYIKNNIFREPTAEERHFELQKQDMTMENIVERLRLNRNIKETELGNNISSFNFTRNAFEKGKWDKETIKARGLFIDTENNKIVARGYEKFFNINEQESSKLFNLRDWFNESNSVIAYKKYNGFLGLLSYYNKQLQFHSKSRNDGEYAEYFKNLFNKQYNKFQKDYITDYLKENNVTIAYEVIDLENDPHIIDEKESRIVLLDIIENELDFRRKSYPYLEGFAKSIGLNNTQYKQVYKVFSTYRELTEFYDEHTKDTNFNDTDIEGIVIECGNKMTKLKFNYYKFWKGMRSVSEAVQGNRQVKLNQLYNATANYFYKFLKDKHDIRNNELIAIQGYINSTHNLDISLYDLKKSKIDFNNCTLTIYKHKNKKWLNDNYNQESTTEDNSIQMTLELNVLKQLEEYRKPLDIISLRKEYYQNNGI